jgi:hypothetical protein
LANARVGHTDQNLEQSLSVGLQLRHIVWIETHPHFTGTSVPDLKRRVREYRKTLRNVSVIQVLDQLVNIVRRRSKAHPVATVNEVKSLVVERRHLLNVIVHVVGNRNAYLNRKNLCKSVQRIVKAF